MVAPSGQCPPAAEGRWQTSERLAPRALRGFRRAVQDARAATDAGLAGLPPVV
jgi:hypothetical protein